MYYQSRTARAAATVAAALDDLGLEWQRSDDRVFAVTLPGTHKLQTACALEIGAHVLAVRAFVARRPDENHERVYGWLLQRNLRLSLIAFSLDRLGDIHLTGRIPLAAVTAELLDTLLGSIAQTADDSFNTILELGFATSITAEWAWRRDRGLPIDNLAAFTRLAPDDHD